MTPAETTIPDALERAGTQYLETRTAAAKALRTFEAEVRQAVERGDVGIRTIARRFGIDPATVSRMAGRRPT